MRNRHLITLFICVILAIYSAITENVIFLLINIGIIGMTFLNINMERNKKTQTI